MKYKIKSLLYATLYAYFNSFTDPTANFWLASK